MNPTLAKANRSRARIVKAHLEASLQPPLCKLVETAPSGSEWIHEPRLDDYRIEARIVAGKPQLLNRSRTAWPLRYPGADL